MTPDECRVALVHAFTVDPIAGSITFHPCGVVSHHPEDVRQTYCGRCHRFVGDVIDLEALMEQALAEGKKTGM